GDRASARLLDTWEAYTRGPSPTTSLGISKEAKILHTLENLSMDDVARLKFYLRQTPNRHHKDSEMTHICDIATAIIQQYKDNAVPALITLLRQIQRLDLVKELERGDPCTGPGRIDPVKTPQGAESERPAQVNKPRDAIDENLILEKVAAVVRDLNHYDLRTFISRLTGKSGADIYPAMAYLYTVQDALKAIGHHSTAERLL
ncbi:MAG: hypothetical protein ACRC4H_15420, partial [Plesiomonas sp.]